MSDPVTWLDVVVLLAAYLVASGLHKLVTGLLNARDRYNELIETGGEAAPDPQDGGTADTSRAVCDDPAASPPLHTTTRSPIPGWRPAAAELPYEQVLDQDERTGA